MTRDATTPRRVALASIRPPSGIGGEALSLADQIAAHLAESIVNDEHQPGDRIHEVAVSERFNVSRGPVREALRILENEGLVQILPRRGAIVTKLSVDEVEDVFELRAVLFGLAARRLAGREGAAAVAEQLRRRVDKLDKLAKREDEEVLFEYVAAVQELNLSICAETGSERLTAMIYSLFHLTLRYSRLGLSTPPRRRQSARNWRALVAHIAAGDPDAAEAAGRKLVEQSREMAIKLLANETG